MSSLSRDDLADEFIELALSSEALKIGDFTLKSGRKSPYFMDVSMIAYAQYAKRLGEMYLELAQSADHDTGTFLGIPYKGIPLAAIAASTSVSDENHITGFCYGYIRKTVKEVGEKGWFGGRTKKKGGEKGWFRGIINEAQPLILVDDVLTAGTAAKDGIEICHKHEFFPTMLLVAFDRMERVSDDDDRPASKMLEEDGLTVCSLANVEDLLRAKKGITKQEKKKIREHLDKYGAKSNPRQAKS